MKKIMLFSVWITLLAITIAVMQKVEKSHKSYKCGYCNDTICSGFCLCDEDFNCQDTIKWCNTCDSLFQADSVYYKEILNEMQ